MLVNVRRYFVVAVVGAIASAAVPILGADRVCALEVSVVDAVGAPIEGMSVAISSADWAPPLSRLTTNSPVRFGDLPCGPIRISVTSVAGDVPVKWASRAVDLQHGSAATETIVVPRQYVVTIQLQDPEGEPVQLGTVRVNRLSDPIPGIDLNQRVAVGPDGRVVFPVVPGKYGVAWDTKDNVKPLRVFLDGTPVTGYPKRVRLTPPDESLREGQAPEDKPVIRVISYREIGLEVSVAAESHEVVFVVEDPKKRTIAGRIEDQSGEPVPGISIEIYRGDAWNCPGCGVTDESGRFEIVVRDFPVRVVPRDRADLLAFQPGDISLSGPADSLQFLAVPTNKVMLRGRVLNADTEQPVAEASVRAQLSCETEPTWDYENASTDRDGRFALPCRPDCSFTLSVWEKHYVPSGETKLGPKSCDEQPVLKLEEGGVLTGTIRDEGGSPLPNLPLAESQRSGSRLQDWSTDGDGEYRIPGMHANWIELIRVDQEKIDPAEEWLYLAGVDESLPEGLVGPVVIVPDPPTVMRRDLIARDGGRLCQATDGSTPSGAVSVQLIADEPGAPARTARSPSLTLDLVPFGEELRCTAPIAPGRYRYFVESQSAVHPLWFPEHGADTGARLVVAPRDTVELPALDVQPHGDYVELDIPAGRVGLDTPIVAQIASADDTDALALDSASDVRWHTVPPERLSLGHLGQVLNGASREIELFSSSLQGIPAGRYHVRMCVGEAPCPESLRWFTLIPVEVRADLPSRAQMFSSAAVLTVDKGALAWKAVGAPARFDVVRGDLSIFRRKEGGEVDTDCLARGTEQGHVQAGDDPAPGSGYWYLVRAWSKYDEGTYSSGGPGEIYPRDRWLHVGGTACDRSADSP